MSAPAERPLPTGPSPAQDRAPRVSVVTTAYNEEQNLPVLYHRLDATLASARVDWELIVVDDHSHDETFAVVTALAGRDPRVSGVRLSRNFGSHAARVCGLQRAEGDCAVVLAADLQDPPELIPEMLQRWREGAQVVAGLRGRRPGETRSTVWLSRLYHVVTRHVVGIREVPDGGAMYFLLDRRVLDVLRDLCESQPTINVLVHWMGFRKAWIPYDQAPRLHGRSGWTLAKKVKLFIDTLTFSDAPLRWVGALGLAMLLLALAVIAALAGAALGDGVSSGWAWVAALAVALAGLQLVVAALLGEYLWRALSESRRRPAYIVEEDVGKAGAFRASRGSGGHAVS